MNTNYEAIEPRRDEVDALPGATLLEFGSPWCGYCRMAQPLLEQALSDHSGIRHIKIADASGRRLGRSFRVKLWPTLVFLADGKEVARLVRPQDARDIREALGKIDPLAPSSPAAAFGGT
jgi:thioredoxin